MARYAVKITAYIDARDDADAARQATVMDKGLHNPLLKMSLKSDGVKPLGHQVDPKPQKV
jgi:hypothetical protein